MATKFYKCPICGNVILKVEDSGITPHCCGQPMTELKAGSIDASKEKHVPVFERLNECMVRVKVGSDPHPMNPEHNIRFVYLETIHGGQLRYLTMGDMIAREASVDICNCKDPVMAVYEYCNIHGLWKAEVNELNTCNYDFENNGRCYK